MVTFRSAGLVAMFMLAAPCAASATPAIADPPTTPNPWLAWLPAETTPDVAGWAPRIAERAADLERRRQAIRGPLPTIDESEPPGSTGANDAPFVAEPLPDLGTLPGQARRLLARGALRPLPTLLAASAEPDDAIPLARPSPLASGEVVRVPGVVGDGAHGSGTPAPSGDFDCLALTVPPGARVELAVVTPDPLSALHPFVAAWDLGGALLGVSDGLPGNGFFVPGEAYLEIVAPASGALVACALGQSFTPRPPGELEDHLLLDPFDGASGPGFGFEGSYDFVVGVDADDPRDRDCWSVELRVGDVLAAAASTGASRVTLRDSAGEVRIESPGFDLSGLQPAGSPLPGGRGGPAAAVVADVDGTWTVELSAASWLFAPSYEVEIVTERPPLDEQPGRRRQRVLLDVDGAVVDPALFGRPPGSVALSPLASFLAGWGLGPSDQDALVDLVVAEVDATLRAEIAALGGNGDARASGRPGDFDLEVLDTRAGDPWGEPDVARVIVGGTIAELGLTTIGIAQDIDPGNFDSTGSAVVLLDLLSGPASSLSSLNRWAPTDPAARLAFVARGLGRIAAHEAGHLLAAFHTDRDLGPTQIMDRGGRLDLLLGVGADGAGGTADDFPVGFGSDRLEPLEGLRGIQDSVDGISFAAPLAGARGELAVAPASLDFAAVAIGSSADRIVSVAAVGGAAVTVIPGLATDLAFGLPVATPFDLAAGASAPLTVRFAPQAPGTAAGLLSLLSAPTGASATVQLRGVGGLGSPSLTPPALDLGDLEYGPAGATLSAQATLANAGPAPLVVHRLGLSGPDATLFSLLPAEVGPLGPGSIPLAVTFAPGGLVGPRSARLIALVADPTSPRLEVLLTARAHGSDLEVSPTSPYFFGLPRPGETRTRTFRLLNAGDRDLVLGTATLEGEDAALFAVLAGPTPSTVPPGGQADLTVRFAPLALGTFEAALALPTNDPDENPATLELAGAGASGQVAVDPEPPLDFGPTPLGAGTQLLATVTNVGALTLRITATTLEGADAGAFALLAGGGAVALAPGGHRDLLLDFAPDRLGPFSAELVIASDEHGLPLRRVLLLGHGGPLPAPPEIPTLGPLGLAALAALLAAAAGWQRRPRRSAGSTTVSRQ